MTFRLVERILFVQLLSVHADITSDVFGEAHWFLSVSLLLSLYGFVLNLGVIQTRLNIESILRSKIIEKTLFVQVHRSFSCGRVPILRCGAGFIDGCLRSFFQKIQNILFFRLLQRFIHQLYFEWPKQNLDLISF